MSPLLGLYRLAGDWQVGLLTQVYHQAEALMAQAPVGWAVSLIPHSMVVPMRSTAPRWIIAGGRN